MPTFLVLELIFLSRVTLGMHVKSDLNVETTLIELLCPTIEIFETF